MIIKHISTLTVIFSLIISTFLIPTNEPSPPKEKSNTVGTEIQGDFNGDGQIDTARIVEIIKGNSARMRKDRPRVFAASFSGGIYSLNVGCCDPILINEGDLNDDGTDEITIYSAPENGCTYSMTTFTWKDNSWNVLVNTFLVPTACEPMSNANLEDRVFKKRKAIYYLETDPNDVNSKLIKKEALLK